jgi:hypothetical protein
VIHLVAGGVVIESVRSHLSTADIARLVATGGRPAGPPPLPAAGNPGAAVEVDRVVSTGEPSVSSAVPSSPPRSSRAAGSRSGSMTRP